MVRCPNCGQQTSGDYCQYCKYPIKMSNQQGGIGEFLFLLFLTVGCFGIATFGLWTFLTEVTPRDGQNEISGYVTTCEMWEKTEYGVTRPYEVRARLAGYDRRLTFLHPKEKLHDVYNGLQLGTHVVLLVEESEKSATIWEGRTNSNVFLYYEDVAEWQKSNKRWGLYVGLGFLACGGYLVWYSVKVLRG